MSFLTVLLIFFMIATTVVLATGLVGFFIGGEFNRKYGTRLMRARVGLQLCAVLIVWLMLMASS